MASNSIAKPKREDYYYFFPSDNIGREPRQLFSEVYINGIFIYLYSYTKGIWVPLLRTGHFRDIKPYCKVVSKEQADCLKLMLEFP